MDAKQKEFRHISRLLANLGYILEEEQPHLSGERFLASPDKLVLVGKRTPKGFRVIIKMSRFAKAKEEIRKEKKVRDTLSAFLSVRKAIRFPKVIYFGRKGSYQIFVTEFIPQNRIFISYPLAKQFSLIVKSFEAREKLNRNTFAHIRKNLKSFPFLRARDYLENFKKFRSIIFTRYHTPGIEEAMGNALKYLEDNKATIEKYCGHLVHTDFAPHNFRISNNSMYTLDCSAFLFGNKYEELARLLNYMVIHNPALEKKLRGYVLNERGKNEYLDLRLMRIYKIGYLLEFYTQSLSKTASDLHALTSCRIEFWEEVLRCIIKDMDLDEKILKSYIENRNNLRSAEEKKRQREFSAA